MLEFAFKARNQQNFTKSELEQSKAMLYFTLFDQETIIEQISKAKQERYVENKYLGSFKVPFTTLLSGNKFEGLVRLNRPLVL